MALIGGASAGAAGATWWLTRPPPVVPVAKPDPGTYFNLECTGIGTKLQDSDRDEPERITRILRVDLKNRRWCEGGCAYGNNIAGLSEASIDFVDPSKTPDSMNIKFSVDRNTGVFTQAQIVGKRAAMQVGDCVKRPFVPIPPPRF